MGMIKFMKILIICTGNSCRSQMAEGFLRSFDNKLYVQSAGTHPEKTVNPNAIAVMREIGIDISTHYAKPVELFIKEEFDYVITVCDDAKEECPVFVGKVKNRIHICFEDPAFARGSDEEVLHIYRKTRDEIKIQFFKFYEMIHQQK